MEDNLVPEFLVFLIYISFARFILILFVSSDRFAVSVCCVVAYEGCVLQDFSSVHDFNAGAFGKYLCAISFALFTIVDHSFYV